MVSKLRDALANLLRKDVESSTLESTIIKSREKETKAERPTVIDPELNLLGVRNSQIKPFEREPWLRVNEYTMEFERERQKEVEAENKELSISEDDILSKRNVPKGIPPGFNGIPIKKIEHPKEDLGES